MKRQLQLVAVWLVNLFVAACFIAALTAIVWTLLGMVWGD